MALWFVCRPTLDEQHDAACFGSKSLSLVGMNELLYQLTNFTSKIGNRSVPRLTGARIIYCIVTGLIKPLNTAIVTETQLM